MGMICDFAYYSWKHDISLSGLFRKNLTNVQTGLETALVQLFSEWNYWFTSLKIHNVFSGDDGGTEKVQASHHSLNMANTVTTKPFVCMCSVSPTYGVGGSQAWEDSSGDVLFFSHIFRQFPQSSARLFERRERHLSFRNVNRKRFSSRAKEGPNVFRERY